MSLCNLCGDSVDRHYRHCLGFISATCCPSPSSSRVASGFGLRRWTMMNHPCLITCNLSYSLAIRICQFDIFFVIFFVRICQHSSGNSLELHNSYWYWCTSQSSFQLILRAIQSGMHEKAGLKLSTAVRSNLISAKRNCYYYIMKVSLENMLYFIYIHLLCHELAMSMQLNEKNATTCSNATFGGFSVQAFL